MNKTLVLIIVFVSLGCATTPKYHASRNEVVPAVKKTEKSFDQKIQTIFNDSKAVNIAEIKTYLKQRLPHIIYHEHFKDTAPKHLKPFVDVTFLRQSSNEKKLPPLFMEISPEGQKAILEYLSKKSKDDDNSTLLKLLKTIRYESVDQTEKSSQIDFNPYCQLRMLVSASVNSFHPADRLEKVYAFIYIPNGAKIVDIRDFKTNTQLLDFGLLTTEEGVSANINPKVDVVRGTSAISNIASATPSFKRQLVRKISREFTRNNIGINHNLNFLFISQEGEEGIDLDGNIETSITIRHDNEPAVVSVFSKNGSGKISYNDYGFHNVGNLKGILVWVAQARVVEKKWWEYVLFFLDDCGATVEERDDLVTPYIFADVHPITIWQNPLQLYFITANKEEKNERFQAQSAVLAYNAEGSESYPRYVAFKSYNEADTFLHMFRKQCLTKEGLCEVNTAEGKKIQLGFITKDNINKLQFIEDKLKEKVSVFITEPDDFPIGYGKK